MENIFVTLGYTKRSPKLQNNNKKINWASLKGKSSCSAKDTIKKMKRQDTDWEKIFANYVSVDSRMCKEL